MLLVIEKNVLDNVGLESGKGFLSGHAIKISLDVLFLTPVFGRFGFLHVEYGRRAAKEGSVEVLVE